MRSGATISTSSISGLTAERHSTLGRRSTRGPVRRELGLPHVEQLPAPAAEVLAAGRGARQMQPVALVELVDAHVGQLARAARFAHVDERALVLEPQAGAHFLPDQRAHGVHAQLLRRLFRRGRHPLADDEGRDHEDHAHLGQRERGAARRQPRAAHHGELRIARQVRQHVERADQHHHREQLVGVRRHRQQHEDEHLAQVVLAAPEVAQLVDQVEEREQRQEAEQHEPHRAEDLARQVALEGAGAHRARRALSAPAAAGSAACGARTGTPAGAP